MKFSKSKKYTLKKVRTTKGKMVKRYVKKGKK